MRLTFKIFSILVLSFLGTINLNGQVSADNTYKFLNLVSSARQVAIGGRIVSIADDDVNFVNWNPAVLNSTMHSKIALNYTDYFSDVNYGSVGYAHNFDSLGVFYAGVNYINYGDFVLSENGDVDGEFSANELSINLAYAYQIDSSFSIGAQMKIINSVLYQWNSYGVAFDIGAIYTFPNKNTTLGLVFRNMGYQLKSYNSDGFLSGFGNENLPFEIQAGISHELEHLPLRWNVSLENLQRWKLAFSNPSFSSTDLDGNQQYENINFADEALRHLVVGLELFPQGNFTARASYNFRRAAEMKFLNYKYFGGLSFGFGMKISKFRINFARSLYHPAGGTNHFSITTDLSAF